MQTQAYFDDIQLQILLELRKATTSIHIAVGIRVDGESSADLTDNRCEGNEASGILFWNSSSGTADNNICSRNMFDGIRVEAESDAALSGNRCEEE